MDVFVVFALLVSVILVSVSAEPQTVNITAVEGENVILPCKAPNNHHNISAVSWTRLDLGKNQHVFSYGDGHIDLDHQLPSYKNRVNLSEELMKDGDVSLILNNVTFNDRGTFECSVVQTGSENKNIKSISLIVLSVDPPGEPEEERRKEKREKKERGKEEGGGRGRIGLIIGLIVVFVVVCVCVAVKCHRNRKKKSDPPSGSDPVHDNLVLESV